MHLESTVARGRYLGIPRFLADGQLPVERTASDQVSFLRGAAKSLTHLNWGLIVKHLVAVGLRLGYSHVLSGRRSLPVGFSRPVDRSSLLSGGCGQLSLLHMLSRVTDSFPCLFLIGCMAVFKLVSVFQ